MPYMKGKLKGELTASEIRKLIRAHNKLVSIKIPPKTDRDGLIKIVQDNGYKIDHKGQKIVDARKSRPRRVKVSLEQANKMTKKTDLDKQKAKEKREENLMKKKKEIRQIKKDAIKKEKEVQKKKQEKKKKTDASTQTKPKKAKPKKAKPIKTQTETPKTKPKKEKPLTQMTDQQIITLMKNIDKRSFTRLRVIAYEENKDDIKEVLENDIEGLEGNVDYYDREVAKYMLKELKKPSSDKVIEEASDENNGDVFLDYYLKLFKEWKGKDAIKKEKEVQKKKKEEEFKENFLKIEGENIEYKGEKMKIKLKLLKKNDKNDIYLSYFKSNNDKKGYAREVLCKILRHLIKKKIITSSASFSLIPMNMGLRGDGGNQKKLEKMYKEMGFKFDKENTEMEQTVKSFLEWCKTHEKKMK